MDDPTEDKKGKRKRPRRHIPIEIVFQVEPLAKARGIESVLHFSQEADLPYATATDLWKGEAKRVDRETLARVCYALQCTPGDVLIIQERGKAQDNQAEKATEPS